MNNETMTCMRQHVSVRAYTGQPVDVTLLAEILQCGQAASSSSFVQAYSVLRVTEPANRERIAQAAGGQRWIIEAPEFLVFCADLRRINYACEQQRQGALEGYTEHFLTATIDTALMAQNVLLAAESVGLGGVFIGGIRNDPAVVCDCLELPHHVYPTFGLCLGWPAQRPEVKPRFPLAMVLHQDRYQSEALAAQVDDYDTRMGEYYASRSSQARASNWSRQTAGAVQGKKRAHMLEFLRQRGFLQR